MVTFLMIEFANGHIPRIVTNVLYLKLVNDVIAFPLLGKMHEFSLLTNTSDHVHLQDIISFL